MDIILADMEGASPELWDLLLEGMYIILEHKWQDINLVLEKVAGSWGGAGGGGFYGGGCASGGSGYIGGVESGKTIAGNQSMPTHDGKSTMTGNAGNGFAKITLISVE